MRFSIYFIIFFFSFFQTFSQERAIPSFRKDALMELTKSWESDFMDSRQRVASYLLENKSTPFKYQLFNVEYELMDVDNFGKPIYLRTLNLGSGQTIGAHYLHQSLGIRGGNIKVGIWDGGRVRPHIEFGGRQIQKDGPSDFSSHATHVSGTVGATGINSDSRGIAPEVTLYTYDWNNDLVEMANEVGSGMLVSNHSYGIVHGWDRSSSGSWSWTGNASIDPNEDYRFGFYSTKSRQLDQLAHTAPYYTIVWAAGNDRNDTGDGSRPPDCNGGTGFDCITTEGTAKNIITVGAVSKQTNYTGPGSISMSSFSSWGPTDDGRIKPDIVAPGVNIFSTNAQGENTYGTSSGTSMAAPAVAGGIALLQEQHYNAFGGYMRSATVRALLAHTAKEAGLFPGPDYRFGWGLFDVEAASKVIGNNNGLFNSIEEQLLENHSPFVKRIFPEEGTKITITIAWTDPAGQPTIPMLDPETRMLVNDLDVYLMDDAGNTILPWVLDPSQPSIAATKGVNFRDNIEKIEFENPLPREYSIVVSHKGNLSGESQNFSLVVSYVPSSISGQVLHWIGGDGFWDTSGNWSNTSGGTPVDVIPTETTNVFIDENSFPSDNQFIKLTSDVKVNSLTWLSKKEGGIAFHGHQLESQGSVKFLSNSFKMIDAGYLVLSPEEERIIEFNAGINDFSNISLILSGAGISTISIKGELNFDSLLVNTGGVVFEQKKHHRLNTVIIGENSENINLNDVEIFELNNFINNSSGKMLAEEVFLSFSIHPDNVGRIELNENLTHSIVFLLAGNLIIKGSQTIGKLVVDEGNLQIESNPEIIELQIKDSSFLELFENSQLNVHSISLTRDIESEFFIKSTQLATLNILGYYKYCFDFLNIQNVNLIGNSRIILGQNSVVVNSENWTIGNCHEALFSNFEVSQGCQFSDAKINSLSSGPISNYVWEFLGNGLFETISGEDNVVYTFNDIGKFEISLTVSNDFESHTTTKEVEIKENTLGSNFIRTNSSNILISNKQALAYQWYRNGYLIPDANLQFYNSQGLDGYYTVRINDGICNIVSDPFIITDVPIFESEKTDIYPNPFFDKVFIKADYFIKEVVVYDALGKDYLRIKPDYPNSVMEISGDKFLPGLNFIFVVFDNNFFIKRRVIKM